MLGSCMKVKNGKRVYNKKEHKYNLKILEDLPFLAKYEETFVVAEVDISDVTNHTEFYKFRTQFLKNLLAYASKHTDKIEVMLAPYRNINAALLVVRDMKSGKTYALAGVE